MNEDKGTLKDGLNERSSIEGVGVDHKRDNPNQVPHKGSEKAKKGGKSFTIK